jgi:hypothetical protein
LGFLKKLPSLFHKPAQNKETPTNWVYVRCNRCGEVLRTRINLYNDLSVEYGETNKKNTFVCRKLISGDGRGSQRCFQKIEIFLRYNAQRSLIDQEIIGGVLADEEDYLAYLAETATKT